MPSSTFSKSDLKNYPHFDAPLSLRETERLVTSAHMVASNTFYPFFLYTDEWQPYRLLPNGKPDKKSRKIRYASRRDAYIFSYYRSILTELYEQRLLSMGISDCPIAYRKLSNHRKSSGKCNIDFAKDAFDHITDLGDCIAIALDISKFFESLDHAIIKKLWIDLLDKKTLPPDHYAVYCNITRYHYVDQKAVYRRLGYLTQEISKGRVVEKFTVPYRKMPKKLCSNEDFRNKICGGDPTYSSLIETNEKDHGVPQGAPISDLIANFYLMDFDATVQTFAKSLGGRYVRYSDDILLILPIARSQVPSVLDFVSSELSKHGPQLKIKDTKTCVVEFSRSITGQTFEHLLGVGGRNGFEYLGFRFDGRKVYLRESTIGGLYRKLSATAHAAAYRHVHKRPHLSARQCVDTFNFSIFSQKFIRVQKSSFSGDYSTWTFWTYMKRASDTFGIRGDRILRQAGNFDRIMRQRVTEAILHAHSNL